MKVDIICPLYMAENYIVDLHNSLLKQKNVELNKIMYILTNSSDKTEEILKSINADYMQIEKREFSHSLVREKAAFESESDIVVFITQDIVIEDELWLYNLTKDIIEGNCEASFSRQISKYKGIEKYTREKNYPKESYIVEKNDINRMGLRAFFFSDASSAIRRDVFVKLKGYDNKDLPISEDMYIAYKMVIAGYKIKYCADSVVFHSHKFSLKQIYNRYYDTGKFFKQNAYLDRYKTNKTGGNLAFYILKRAIQDRNIAVLIQFIPNMTARFLGMKMGKIKG